MYYVINALLAMTGFSYISLLGGTVAFLDSLSILLIFAKIVCEIVNVFIPILEIRWQVVAVCCHFIKDVHRRIDVCHSSYQLVVEPWINLLDET